MRQECKRCGKKYNKKHERCPHCGDLVSYVTSYRAYSTLEAENSNSYLEPNQNGIERKVHAVQQLQEVGTTQVLEDAEERAVSQSIKQEDNRYYQDEEMRAPRERVVVERPVIRWRWMILIGILILGIYYGGTWYSYYSRYPVSDEKVIIQQVHKGQKIETKRIKMQVESAYTIENQWLEQYILEGYQFVGIQLKGQIKEELEGYHKPSIFFISYERDGKEVYQQVVGDWKINDYLYEQGYNVISGYNTFEIKEEGMVFFCIEEGVKAFKLHYQEPVKRILGIDNEVEIYEVELVVEGGLE